MVKRSAIVLAAAALAVAGCGDDDDDEGASGAEAKPTALAIGLSDKAVTGPTTVPAGLVELTVTNTSKKPADDAQIVSVDGDQTAKDVLKVVAGDDTPIPDWLHGAGGVGGIAPGGKATSTQVLEPGRHFVIGGDDAEPLEFEVTGEASGATVPEGAATITASEYTFKTTGLKAGTNEVSFVNDGKQLHHVIAAPLAKGTSFAKAKKALMSGEEDSGPPPLDFANTVSTPVMDGGRSLGTTLRLKAGTYVLVCFIPNRGGGPGHNTFGMIKEVTIQ